MKTQTIYRTLPALKTRHILLILAILVGALADAFGQVPEDSDLYRTILDLDQAYFTAYNECDMATQEELLSDSLEFYHDQGGLSPSKSRILESIEDNVCGQVSRRLVP